MALQWKSPEPRPDPFEAVAGDRTEYRVHFAESAAVDPAGIEAAIDEVVAKALSFFKANKGDRSKRILFLWDVVYATLTVVYTDSAMTHDAHDVTKCYFSAIDAEETAKALSNDVRRMIESSMARYREAHLPASMLAFYSDQDRACCSPAAFEAQAQTIPKHPG